MITLMVLFTIMYLISWYSFYESDYEIIYMPDLWYLIFMIGNVLLILTLIILIGLYLP
jgi:hypothetical protein